MRSNNLPTMDRGDISESAWSRSSVWEQTNTTNRLRSRASRWGLGELEIVYSRIGPAYAIVRRANGRVKMQTIGTSRRLAEKWIEEQAT